VKIDKKCKEVLDKTEWIAIATVGADGPHLADTWGEYVKALGGIDGDTLFVLECFPGHGESGYQDQGIALIAKEWSRQDILMAESPAGFFWIYLLKGM